MNRLVLFTVIAAVILGILGVVALNAALSYEFLVNFFEPI